MSKTNTPIQKTAKAIRDELPVEKQPELFRMAVEAGYLAALADGDADPVEMEALVHAIEELSDGVVIGWEVEVLIEECNECLSTEGHNERAEAVGRQLKELGYCETGLLIAAFVSLATGGLDDKEEGILVRIGEAAGLDKPVVESLVEKARKAF